MLRPVLLVTACVLGALCAPSSRVSAEDDASPLRVRVAIDRHVDGELVESRLVELATVVGGPASEVRQGREVPIGDEYRNVGTNLSCRVSEAESGEGYLVRFGVEQSSLVDGTGPARFDTFHVSSSLVLDRGQSSEFRAIRGARENERFTMRVSLED